MQSGSLGSDERLAMAENFEPEPDFEPQPARPCGRVRALPGDAGDRESARTAYMLAPNLEARRREVHGVGPTFGPTSGLQ